MAFTIRDFTNIVGTGLQLYNTFKSKDAAKANPGVAGQSAIMAALMDPSSPTYQRLLAEEEDRQYGNIIDYIKRSDIMRRRAAARGANISRSEREDEARHKALADAARQAEVRADTAVQNRLRAAAGVADPLAGNYNTQQGQISDARAATVESMVGLMQNLGKQYEDSQNTRSDNLFGSGFQQGGGSETINWDTNTGGWGSVEGWL